MIYLMVETIFLTSQARKMLSLSPFLFKIVPEIIASTIRQEKERKGKNIGKEEVVIHR